MLAEAGVEPVSYRTLTRHLPNFAKPGIHDAGRWVIRTTSLMLFGWVGVVRPLVCPAFPVVVRVGPCGGSGGGGLGMADDVVPESKPCGGLEAHLAALAVEVPHITTRHGDIGAVIGFLRGVRQHRWAGLPVDSDLYPDDHPRLEQSTASRAIPEFLMNQLETPMNLDRIADPRIRLLIDILIGTGLRIGDATRLSIDCLVRDPAGAT